MSEKQSKYKEYEGSRKEYTDKILSSKASKKVIIAGPGLSLIHI